MKKKAPPPKEKEAPKFYHCMDCRKILRSMVCLKDHVNADMCSRQPHTCLENHEHENLEYYFECKLILLLSKLRVLFSYFDFVPIFSSAGAWP